MDGNERENLVTVPPEAGAGPGKTTHQTSEDSGGVEGLPEAAREVGKDELQGHNHSHHCHNRNIIVRRSQSRKMSGECSTSSS